MCFIIMRPPAQIYAFFTGVFAGGGGPTANVSGLTGKINGSGNSAGLRVYLLQVGGGTWCKRKLLPRTGMSLDIAKLFVGCVDRLAFA